MKLHIKEKNGYPDNNYTKEEYMAYINDYKKKLSNILKNLDKIAEKELEINDRGDYSSILAAENEEDLFKRDALLHCLKNVEYICGLIMER